METTAQANRDLAPSVANGGRLFLIGVVALFTAAFNFAVRAAIAKDLKTDVFDNIDPVRSGQMVGSALGVAFLGFAITTFAISPFLNRIGMGRALYGAAFCFVVGPLLVALAGGGSAYNMVWLGMLLCGLGWGLTEATINPMTAAIYPGDKTHRMNVLHAWWPAGLVVGGLVGFGAGSLGLDWRALNLLTLLPALAVVMLVWGQSFPKTQSDAMGVSTKDMMTEVFRRPSFFIWFGLMFLTAATELAPGQWVDIALTQVVGMRGILLLVFVSSMMFVMRHFAGPLVAIVSPVGLMLVSSTLAGVGLMLLSSANSPATALLAAAFWGSGVCFMWPTMLAISAERYPRGGAWAIGLIASAGALSIYFVLPQLGAVYDANMSAAAGGRDQLAALSEAAKSVLAVDAARASFRTIAIFPTILVFAFGAIFMFEYFNKGKKA